LLILLLTVFSVMSVFSQVDTSLRADSQTVISPVGLHYKSAKSPMLALGLSALLPGAGQIYTENYWKVPIIWGVSGYWIYEWIQMNSDYRDFRNLYLQDPTSQYLRLRDYYRDERDRFAWFLAGLYILNLVDAYAGAHLYDFDVSPDVTYNGKILPRVTVSIKIPF
jgi:hypothetical protein